MLGLRVFRDEADKMNRSLTDIGGSVLVVSQFTLYADVSHGRRPSFTGAAGPDIAVPLYEQFLKECGRLGFPPQHGTFGAYMAEAVAESGIKANLSRGTSMFLGDGFDFETFPACRELVAVWEKWHNYDHGRIRIECSVHAEYTSTYQLWDALGEYALNNGLHMHVHLSETKREHDECVEKYGLTPAQILDCHHVFDVPGIAAHCVWVTKEDMLLPKGEKIAKILRIREKS